MLYRFSKNLSSITLDKRWRYASDSSSICSLSCFQSWLSATPPSAREIVSTAWRALHHLGAGAAHATYSSVTPRLAATHVHPRDACRTTAPHAVCSSRSPLRVRSSRSSSPPAFTRFLFLFSSSIVLLFWLLVCLVH